MKKHYLVIISILMVATLGAGVFEYVKTFQAEIVTATSTIPNPGHAWSEMECNSDSLCVDTVNNKLGIGTTSPSQKLEVNGSILAVGDVCNGSGSCLSQLNSFTGSQPIAGGTNHSRAQCTSTGGTLVANPDYANPICRFDASSCPSGWAQFNNWSTNIANTCYYKSTYVGGPNNMYACCSSYFPCVAPGSSWSDYKGSCGVPAGCSGGPCGDPGYTAPYTCWATTTQIGCY